MRKPKQLLLALGAFCLSFNLSAQNYTGIYGSNYAGVMATDLNPAAFVDGRFVVDVNLGSFGMSTWTNAMSFTTKDMPKWWVKSFKPDVNGVNNEYNDWMSPDSTFMDRYVTRNYSTTSTNTLGVYNNVSVDVLNFAFHINRDIAVGFAAKYRSITNLDDVDPKLAILFEEDWDVPSLWDQKFNEELLDLNHLTWMEYGLLYSQIIKQDGEHFMKVGGKAKWLSGVNALYLHTSNFEYNVDNDSTMIHLSGDMEYGHSTGMMEQLGNSNFQMSFKDFIQGNSKFGVGLDLGFVYEWRPDWEDYKYDMDGETNLWRRDTEKYKLRAGLSILDIGGMKFEKGGISRNFSVNTDNPFLFRQAFDGDNSLVDVDHSIDSLINDVPNSGWTANEEPGGTFFMQLPTAVSLQLDYHIWKWFYVNATGNLSVQNRKNPHRVRIPNQFSITPSFDHAWYGLHLPIVYNTYSGLRAGLGMRLGPLTVGVTDWGVLFASGKKVQGATVYAGLRVPILYGHPSDIDGDKVSDEKDECEVVPGLWEFQGCPDSDRDGIKDLEDHCPQEAGLPEFNGCPDKDGDGIPDKDDACPELAGDAANNGCPDTDGDGIIDPNDDCPETPGLPAFKGCPDTDGDGIKDDEDACPDVPGPLVNNGCPDTDNDGLFDFIDNCPEEYGPKENNGCPWPDTDGDGLLDKDDKCPYIAGPIKNEGCPYEDTDNDGVLDKDDKCPNTPGTVANEGCPEIEEEVAEILRTAFENLEFETGKDIIKVESIPSLTELADVLVKRTEWKLQIAGHTDNVGNDQANLVLSKKRAEAVKNFMMSKGISGDRLFVLFFGETMPIADNDTPEGRQKNRRVEMTIIFE